MQNLSSYHLPMCSNYETVKDPKRIAEVFDVMVPPEVRDHVWPGYESIFIRRPREADAGDAAVPKREVLVGLFGMVPHWAADIKGTRFTYNARTETVAEKPSFKDAWSRGRHCIIPAEAIYEPDWRTGKAIATRIFRADGQPMGIAGLWTGWKAPDGSVVRIFTMLTINAAEHSLMQNFHKPKDEKRMVVILQEDAYGAWLQAPAEDSMDFMRMYTGELLTQP